MTDSDSEDEKFPKIKLQTQISVSRGQVANAVLHNLLKLLKLFTAISLTVLLALEDDCGPLMLPLLILIAFTLYCDVILYAMVPIAFNHCNQECARKFYSVYTILKWVIRVVLVILSICYNIFSLSSMNSCELGESADGKILLAILVAIDFCLLVYCSFVSVVGCSFALHLINAR
mmetsp:Transcript_15789/g.28860  ORF Transcript_15789/g.28860 Transcript_15789/m.28860 type:complete len:175 (+) Transcript_15789:5038-5562(+)